MATKRDVARKANVSPSTVSRVINENGYVSAHVRERVLEAIRELEYVPNRIARSLRTSESRQISCITHSITNPFYSEILLGIEEAAYENGYTFALYNANFHQRNYREVIREGVHDGMIVMSPVELLMDFQDQMMNIPTVVLWDWSNDPPIHSVRIDLNKAICQAVNFLVQQGHTDIAFLGFSAQTADQNPRLQGYLQSLARHQIPVAEERIRLIPKWGDNFQAGYNLTERLLADGVSFTAIAASNDLMAVGAMRALMENGISIPQDVSVTGVDDIELSQMITPALTTVNIPKREIGKALFQLLLEQMQGKLGSGTVEFSTELAVRESVASLSH